MRIAVGGIGAVHQHRQRDIFVAALGVLHFVGIRSGRREVDRYRIGRLSRALIHPAHHREPTERGVRWHVDLRSAAGCGRAVADPERKRVVTGKRKRYCAGNTPTKLPLTSVTISVNGRVGLETELVTPAGLKSMLGNDCMNTYCCVAGVLKTPEPSAVRDFAHIATGLARHISRQLPKRSGCIAP